MIVVPDFVWIAPLVLNSGFTISTKYCSECGTVARDADALTAEADALGAANILALMLVKSQPVTLREDEMASEQC